MRLTQTPGRYDGGGSVGIFCESTAVEDSTRWSPVVYLYGYFHCIASSKRYVRRYTSCLWFDTNIQSALVDAGVLKWRERAYIFKRSGVVLPGWFYGANNSYFNNLPTFTVPFSSSSKSRDRKVQTAQCRKLQKLLWLGFKIFVAVVASGAGKFYIRRTVYTPRVFVTPPAWDSSKN